MPAPRPADLGVVVVSHDDERWLPRCLASVDAAAGGATVSVAVVENGSARGAADAVRRHLPGARVLRVANRGFGAACNDGWRALRARHALFLNPDTELRDGSLGDVAALLDRRPEVGVVGVRQVDAAGRVRPTMRRFPSFARQLGEALAVERWPVRAAGERVLDAAAYERESECDWVTGSFLAVSGDVLRATGGFDERFFLFSEECDLCLRARRAGWRTLYSPALTVVHHDSERRGAAAMEAHAAASRRLYARLHLPPAHRGPYLAALALRYATHSLPRPRAGAEDRRRRAAARRALLTMTGLRAAARGGCDHAR